MVYFPHHIHHGRLERDGLPIHPSIIHSPHSYIWILDQPQPHTVHVQYTVVCILYTVQYILYATWHPEVLSKVGNSEFAL